MIRLLKRGKYILGETKHNTRLLYLDGTCYIWNTITSIGDILQWPMKKHEPYVLFSSGDYKIYDIKNEPDIVDLKHLELQVGENIWQGYLLLTGLPYAHKKRSRIIPTKELVIDGKRQKTRQVLQQVTHGALS